MIAVDTNILVYAYRPDYDARQGPALAALQGPLSSPRSWSIPWPCVHEFLANVTSARIYRQPAAPADALAAVLGVDAGRQLQCASGKQARISIDFAASSGRAKSRVRRSMTRALRPFVSIMA